MGRDGALAGVYIAQTRRNLHNRRGLFLSSEIKDMVRGASYQSYGLCHSNATFLELWAEQIIGVL